MYVDKMAEVFTPKRIVLETPEDVKMMRAVLAIACDSEKQRLPSEHVSGYQSFADSIYKLLVGS